MPFNTNKWNRDINRGGKAAVLYLKLPNFGTFFKIYSTNPGGNIKNLSHLSLQSRLSSVRFELVFAHPFSLIRFESVSYS